VKKIVLPPTEGGYYRFGELPQLIAEALHPDEMYPDDLFTSVIAWRDDGTERGQYIKCTPPNNQHANRLDNIANWLMVAVGPSEEAEDPDAHMWDKWRRDAQAETGGILLNELVFICGELTNHEVIQALNIGSECKWYKDRMREDARRDTDDVRRLCVVDGNLNGLTYTHSAALDRGWVHIDRLNQWGATLETVNVFSTVTTQQPTYFPPMFERLQPRTEWRGSRMVGTDVLTLAEAARLASNHVGEQITQEDFLRAAGRGEIALRAVVHRSAKVRRNDGGVYCNVDTANENMVPAGSVPTLPLIACQHLAATGRARWRTFDGFKQIDGMLMRYTEAQLSEDEPDFETVHEDCRLTGNDVHALADAFVAPSSTEQRQQEAQGARQETGQDTQTPNAATSATGLTTAQIAQAFSFVVGLKAKLGDVNNHKWLLPARQTKGQPPTPATWCPLLLADLLVSKGAATLPNVNAAFTNVAALRAWRDAWQEARRERNAFGL
jgi:hypothetical protein